VISAFNYGQKVRKSMNQEVDGLKIKHDPRVAGRNTDGHRSIDAKSGRFANRPFVGCTEFREQSENVYENKGQGKKVEKSRSQRVEAHKTKNWPPYLRFDRSGAGGGPFFDFSIPKTQRTIR
jgi:hypothetical protein